MARILIAEDEPDIRELVAFTLRFAGHEVVTTNNGEEAYHKAQEIIPDLIMMDVRMPRMTGYDACRAMKQIPSLRDIPVVFLSAKGQETEIQSGLEAGAEEYLLKPFAPDQLVERVKSILSKFGK
ncbi:MAG: Phosphate regulon transcriptional regulatory protein PhoB [Anaerolineales bacterium]|nr:Phosphate regulon transcriptional regulatory protein PhoB [Anaerolineales bacterium]